MAEWFKALALKSSDVKASVGSNPTLSATAGTYFNVSVHYLSNPCFPPFTGWREVSVGAVWAQV